MTPQISVCGWQNPVYGRKDRWTGMLWGCSQVSNLAQRLGGGLGVPGVRGRGTASGCRNGNPSLAECLPCWTGEDLMALGTAAYVMGPWHCSVTSSSSLGGATSLQKKWPESQVRRK